MKGISAHDWRPAATPTIMPAVQIARLLAGGRLGDVIDVSSARRGKWRPKTDLWAHVHPFADRIRNEVGIQTMAVGAISEADQACRKTIAAGQCRPVRHCPSSHGRSA
jgi:anthraniloyl-CoA monooxygenase